MKPADAEVMVLQSLVGDASVSIPDTASRLDRSGVTVSDFERQDTQAIFVALADALRAGARPEALSVIRHCGKRASREVVMQVLTEAAPGYSAQRLGVLRDSALRRIAALALRKLAGLFEGPGPYDAALGEVHRVVGGLGNAVTGRRSADGDLMALLDKIEANARGEREPVLKTGIAALDFAIGGLRPELIVIGAMPGVGKSALLASIMRNVAAGGAKAGLVSLEDPREWVVERLVAADSGVSVRALTNQRLTPAQLDAVSDAGDRLHPQLRNIVIDDRHGLTTDEVVAAARGLVSEGCKAVFVDHLGEIRVKRSERHDLDIADALQSLRGIAKTYRVPVVVACHLRRRDGLDLTTEPRMTDFAFSAAVERMARVALGLSLGVSESGKPDRGPFIQCVVMKQTKGPAHFSFPLNMLAGASVVAPTEPPESLRRALGDA